MLKVNNHKFAIDYLYYKETIKITKSVNNFCLFYSNKIVSNLTYTFFTL